MTNEMIQIAIAEVYEERRRNDNRKAVELVRRISATVTERNNTLAEFDKELAVMRKRLAELSPTAPLTAADIMG